MRLRIALATANKSPCLFGASKSTVQDALVASAQTLNPVQIIGDGPGQTVLAGTSGGHTLRLSQGGSKVSGVTILAKEPDAGQTHWAGLELVGADAENVSVSYGGSKFGVVGILTTQDADIRKVSVDMSVCATTPAPSMARPRLCVM